MSHFAGALPQLTWQPSDADAALCELVRSKLSEEQLGNVHAPVHLDVLKQLWPLERADAVLSINMIHVVPWAAAQGLINGSARIGLRDLEAVVRLTEDAGFALADVVDMPANNLSVIFCKRDTTTPAADDNE